MYVILRLAVHTFFFSKTHPYKQTYVNSNNREIIGRIFYGVQSFISALLLRTLRFPEIRTCKTTDEVGYVITTIRASNITDKTWHLWASFCSNTTSLCFIVYCYCSKCPLQLLWNFFNINLITILHRDMFMKIHILYVIITLILRRSRTGTVWFYTSTSNKRAARPKLYTDQNCTQSH